MPEPDNGPGAGIESIPPHWQIPNEEVFRQNPRVTALNEIDRYLHLRTVHSNEAGDVFDEDWEWFFDPDGRAKVERHIWGDGKVLDIRPLNDADVEFGVNPLPAGNGTNYNGGVDFGAIMPTNRGRYIHLATLAYHNPGVFEFVTFDRTFLDGPYGENISAPYVSLSMSGITNGSISSMRLQLGSSKDEQGFTVLMPGEDNSTFVIQREEGGKFRDEFIVRWKDEEGNLTIEQEYVGQSFDGRTIKKVVEAKSFLDMEAINDVAYSPTYDEQGNLVAEWKNIGFHFQNPTMTFTGPVSEYWKKVVNRGQEKIKEEGGD